MFSIFADFLYFCNYASFISCFRDFMVENIKTFELAIKENVLNILLGHDHEMLLKLIISTKITKAKVFLELFLSYTMISKIYLWLFTTTLHLVHECTDVLLMLL